MCIIRKTYLNYVRNLFSGRSNCLHKQAISLEVSTQNHNRWSRWMYDFRTLCILPRKEWPTIGIPEFIRYCTSNSLKFLLSAGLPNVETKHNFIEEIESGKIRRTKTGSPYQDTNPISVSPLSHDFPKESLWKCWTYTRLELSKSIWLLATQLSSKKSTSLNISRFTRLQR